jgi:hypothetical protein
MKLALMIALPLSRPVGTQPPTPFANLQMPPLPQNLESVPRSELSPAIKSKR